MIGSDVDYSKIPTAIVVQTVIANQFHIFNSGLASLPPNRTLPNEEKHTATHRIRQATPTARKKNPKWFNTQRLAVFVIEENHP